MPAYDRSNIMRKAANLVRERHDHIAKVMTQEQGKPYPESRAEVMTTADIIDWYAEEGRRTYGRIVPGRAKGVRQIVTREPVGVVAAFTPWNFPTLTPVRKIAGALAAGCSIIIKASEETPGGCVELVKCFADAGVPAGVVNMVFGVPAEVSEHLIASDVVKKVSFTGSIPVGKLLAGLAAKGMKRATMELGGHSPVVVFGDADAEKAADTIAAFKYRNAGQVCISPTRFYVQQDSYNKFVNRFTEYAKGIKLGDGLEKGTTMGPLANPRRLDAMESIVQDSKARGGKVVTGGSRHGNQGYFFQPTVITDLPDDSKLMTVEPFGPVAPIVPFKTFDEVVERANSLEYGLAAYAFTSSSATAIAIGDAIQSGMVGVNSVAISTPETPFGGIKESGYGSEGGIEGLEAYTNVKFISQA
jgi:succinate-semialdehyde dehydrogenase/glutarate-semialdehyde dehydrogenase